ncbi:ABC transporter ATP-binding protein [Fumia xinanensis]|uniref:ABC transporter ATP-binding protein n=1 Tax=Fumia xinanensis TaxID=2763659 RepID=A0A926I862_9FIRM|nr:ABC transporter ATP-binding protein [Fumia xinanensis]MBC8560639.1 ABC transporter ATP-binding protein [Fumia xinanensis]
MHLMSPSHQKMEQILGQTLQYSLDYNLNVHGMPTSGSVAISDEELILFRDEIAVKRIPLQNINEFKVVQMVGSGALQIVLKEKTEQLCIFTQDLLPVFADLAKMLEYHRETGVFPAPDDEEPVKTCPKCGLVIPEQTNICFHCAPKGKYLWRIVKLSLRYKATLLTALVATLIIQLLWVVFTYMKGLVVDNYVTSGSQDFTGLLLMMGGYLIIPLLLFGLEYINERCSSYTAAQVGRDLRGILFERIQNQSMKNALKRPTGEQIKRIANDTEKVQDFVSYHGKEAVVRVFSVSVILAVMFWMNWKLTCWIVLPIIAGFFFSRFIFKRMNHPFRINWKLFSKMESVLYDILSGIMAVKVFGSEKREIKHYSGCSEKFAHSMYVANFYWFVMFPVSTFVVTLGEYFYLYFGGNDVLSGVLSFGKMVTFLSCIGLLYAPLNWLMQLPRQLAQTAISAGKIFEIIDEKEDVLDRGNAIDKEIEGNVAFEHVHFGYKVYNPVLKDINFSVKKGEMIGIVGPSGVGKSTMINLIMRLYDVSNGQILIDGTDIRDISQHSLRSQIGVVLQETYLFDGTVWDNLIYAKPDATMEEVVQAAKIANAHDFICKMPDGYQEYIGSRGYKLSGGEKQRIAIARAILRDPKILILDEATASLDTETEKMIQEALKNLTRDRTTFAIAHRLSTLRNADRLIVLDGGRIVEMGTHEELLRHKSVYYNLVMAQRQTSKLSKEPA